MRAKPNPILTETASRSALRFLPEPLLLCDEQLRLCMKNICAQELYPNLHVGICLEPFVRHTPHQTVLALPSETIPVLLLSGEVCQQRCSILLPEHIVLPPSNSAALRDAVSRLNDRVSCAVSRLLSVSADASLERSCLRLLHLRRSILQAAGDQSAGDGHSRGIPIIQLIRQITEPLRESLPALGYRLQLNIATENAVIQASSIRTLQLTVLLSLYNLLLVSVDGSAALSFEEDTLTISTACRSRVLEEASANEMAIVSALSEMADLHMEQVYEDGRLTVTCKLPYQPAELLLRADIAPLSSSLISRLFSTLPLRQS